METRYSVPGTPFSQLREMSDSEVFHKLQNGAVLHFHEGHGNSLSSIRYEGGEWVYTFQRVEQRFENLLQLVFRMNGLGVAFPTPDGEDMDVTLKE